MGAGYLDAKQMSGTFQLLRSNDLFWSRLVHDYLMGQRSTPIDIMAWNADTTRMPYRMHSEYLRALFLNNDLAEGRFNVGDRPITIHDIRIPIFAVGTEKDHVAPWRSVFKFHFLADGDVTFVLTNGGHNAGILSEPGHPQRHFRIARHRHGKPYIDPETLAGEQFVEGGILVAVLECLVGRTVGRACRCRLRSAARTANSRRWRMRPAGTS